LLSRHVSSLAKQMQPLENGIPSSSEGKVRRALLGRLYLVASLFILLAIVLWHSEQFHVLGSGYMLGWDNPNYVRLANELSSNGLFQTVATWSYPQLYVQLLAAVGDVLGNVTLVDRVLPVAFGFLSICAVFLIVLDLSANVHLAGVSSILQATSISFLKLVSGNDRNLMALSLTFVAMLLVKRMWSQKSGPKDYFSLAILSAVIAGTSFETFLIFSLALIISAVLTWRRHNILTSIPMIVIPVVLLFVAFPSYFLTYVQTVQTPIQTPKQVLGPADLVYWMGDSVLIVGTTLVGIAYAFVRWRRKNDALSLLIFIWGSLLMAIFVAAYVGLAGLQAEFGVRALLLVPGYVLVPLGVFVFWVMVSRILRQGKLRMGRAHWKTIANGITVTLIIAIVLISSLFAISESGTYFNTYISATAYNKMVLGSNYVAGKNLGIPVIVFDGSAGYDSLYRGYVGALMGEHFAYYGDINNLLQLKPTAPNSTDPYTYSLEALLTRTYLNEITGNVSGPTEFGHSSYITNPTALMSHPIILITPELYDGPLPGSLLPFYVGNGIYVVTPGGLAPPQRPEADSNITISRDGLITNLQGTYTSLDPTDPTLRYLIVDAASGFENYNVTSYPSDWRFLGILQGGNPSGLDFQPKRPDGKAATAGNDYADSIREWASIPVGASIESDTLSKMEGYASVRVQGSSDPYGNLGLTLSLRTADLSLYNTISFWTKCIGCSAVALSLVDTAGKDRLVYPEIDQGSPASQFKRFSADIGKAIGASDGFDVKSVASMSFLAHSTNGTAMTFWIDDVVVDSEVSNPAFLFKGRVLPRDQVEFLFEETVQGSENVASVFPFLSYPPVMDEFAYVATAFIFVAIIMGRFIRSLRSPIQKPNPV
jgi:hypothetical protein